MLPFSRPGVAGAVPLLTGLEGLAFMHSQGVAHRFVLATTK